MLTEMVPPAFSIVTLADRYSTEIANWVLGSEVIHSRKDGCSGGRALVPPSPPSPPPAPPPSAAVRVGRSAKSKVSLSSWGMNDMQNWQFCMSSHFPSAVDCLNICMNLGSWPCPMEMELGSAADAVFASSSTLVAGSAPLLRMITTGVVADESSNALLIISCRCRRGTGSQISSEDEAVCMLGCSHGSSLMLQLPCLRCCRKTSWGRTRAAAS
jgi:hypothetical protein